MGKLPKVSVVTLTYNSQGTEVCRDAVKC